MSSDETYDLSPDKRTLTSLKSDVTPIAAVKELVDNVIDNWRRLGDENSDVTVDIFLDFQNSVFRIEDDSGGLSEKNVKKIFALGGSTTKEIAYSIGSYGMGAKKAIVRLGNNAEIKSRSADVELGYGFKITEEWLNNEGWSVNKEVYDDLTAGSTVIEITDLNIEFDEAGDDDEERDSDEIPAQESPEEFIDKLRNELTGTYSEFLIGRAGPEDGELTIKVNGQRIEDPDGLDWSYTPVDGFYPRFYKNYELSPDDLPGREEPVKVDVIAGIMPTGEMEESGTDVIIQNRRILTSEKGEMGGWGTSHLKNHSDNIARVRSILKISAENNPEDLPWDTQKGRIEVNNVIADRAFHFLGRTLGEYAAARYEYLPTPFSETYGENGDVLPMSSPEELDYSSQYQVHDKPDTSFSHKGQIEELADDHADRGISAQKLLAEVYRPAYNTYLEESDEIDEDELWEVPESVDSFPERRLHLWLDVVKQLAERHADIGNRIEVDSQVPWWYPYYQKIIADYDGAAEEDENSSTEPEVADVVESRIDAGEIPELILESSELRANGNWLIGEGEKPDHEETEDSTSEEENQEDEETGGVDEVQTGDETEGREGNSDTGDGDGDDGTEPPEFGGTVGRDVQQGSSDQRQIIITVPEPSYEEICENLGMDVDSAPARKVGDAIAEQGLDILPHLDTDNNQETE